MKFLDGTWLHRGPLENGRDALGRFLSTLLPKMGLYGIGVDLGE